jgi:DNA-binding NtrC family response regulator
MTAEGQEVLVIDADPRIQRGIAPMLQRAGLTPTVIAEAQRALDLSVEKFFAVAVVDLDTPEPGGGLEVLAGLRERSPGTALVAMAGQASFEQAVAAFRFGVDDVIAKSPEQVAYLRDRILELAEGQRRRADEGRLLAEVSQLHDDFFKELLESHRKLVSLEEGAGADAAPEEAIAILVVDDQGWLGGELAGMLQERGGYALTDVATGGEALDVAGRERFQIALVKESLLDLPGSMVARTIKAQAQDTIVLLFSQPEGPRPGRVEVVDTQRSIPFLPAFVAPSQLAERLGELTEAYHATHRQRRYLASFRQQHFELLRRYQETKAKLQKAR